MGTRNKHRYKPKTKHIFKLKYCSAPNCLNPPAKYHICPYAIEIKNSDEECNCCDECTKQCGRDI